MHHIIDGIFPWHISGPAGSREHFQVSFYTGVPGVKPRDVRAKDLPKVERILEAFIGTFFPKPSLYQVLMRHQHSEKASVSG